MSQTFFNHDLKDRYTWFNGDSSTKKVLDYILVDPYTQQFMKECKVSIESSDFDSDHRLIMAYLATQLQKGLGENSANQINQNHLESIQSPLMTHKSKLSLLTHSQMN